MKYKKILKILIGCFLLLCSIITFVQTITWQVKRKDYNKEYVYSDSGLLYYEKNDERIYIEKIYNTNGEILQINVPDKKTIIMYCYKDTPTEGIFLGMNNTADSRLQYPIINIYVSALILTIALVILSKKQTKNPIIRFYPIYVFILLVGIGMSCWQIHNIINYCTVKDDNNIVNATIYSDIYVLGNTSGRYQSVSSYYINDNKYVYVDDIHKYGNINDVLGTTQKLYYNLDNPAKVVKELKLTNFLYLIIGIFITAFTFPIVFFRNKMANRFNHAVRKNKYGGIKK